MTVAKPVISPAAEGTFSMRSLHSPSALDVMADDDHAVANAGLALTAILAERLGIEALADELVDLGARPGAARPGRKILTLAQAIVADGDCIDDVVRHEAHSTGWDERTHFSACRSRPFEAGGSLTLGAQGRV